MMFWYGDGMNGWGLCAHDRRDGGVLALVIVGIVMLVRAATPPGRHRRRRPMHRHRKRLWPCVLLGGEIDEDEYRRRLDALHTHRPGPAA